MRVLAVIAGLALVACTGGGATTTKPKGPKLPDISEKKARRGASDLVEEIYATLGRGSKDSMFTLLDDALVVFGPRRTDTLATRADALTALGTVIDPKAKKRLALRSGSLEVVASPGGRSAWAADVVSVNGDAMAVLAILTNIDDLWLVRSAALARMPTAKKLESESKKDAVVPPGATGAKKIDPAAEGAVERFQEGLLDQGLWGDDLGSRSDAIVIGPAQGEVTRGKKAIKKLWQKRMDAKVRAATNGGITAAVTGDGQLAWVSAPITRVAEGEEPLPLRAFAVFEKSGDGWKLIALHESAALDEPGAAAKMKKVLPPELPEEKPPEVVEEPKQAKKSSSKKKKKKKKKRRKKKKSSDRDD